MSNDNLFKNIEQKSGVDMKAVFKLADEIKGANFQDEATIRDIIKRVAALANRPVSKEKEDELVNAILNNPQSINFNNLSKMINKNKK
ncbi:MULTISPECIES: stage VI sporulation protein F [Bacillaceae]|uniref:Stage VI sporulation protein F n=1 Tax=Evansella alkalicola TaxID=745819 RepID=A0ABS6JSR4_9BACI|nr:MULTISPECIES: stage VI sporulation protein F [Bacillaceae]MBU9721465.1 stage VI sporulation protein F [Bacillus alkalicola]